MLQGFWVLPRLGCNGSALVSCKNLTLKGCHVNVANRSANSLLLFLVFFPRVATLPNSDAEKQYTWRTAVTVAFVCLLHGLVVIIVSVALVISRPYLLGTWANILGIVATVLAGIQYLPQIWMTWYLGHVGSLSIPMMLIQTPGSFVWSASLAARLGVEGWSSWGVFLVTGCLQGCLLVMGICFEVKARRERQNAEVAGVSIALVTLLSVRASLIRYRQMKVAAMKLTTREGLSWKMV